ncbi:UDP-N-acetylglucosamine diphosphorylase/glucosamine-1-phosphate N-acetyltransferase [Deinococcus detaillensis]|uniref:Bifunctional protein GlmU n=1 Tax=Deinococcus detaillensis TaxID=2592048 RepID=A0A553UWR8_9DEIO|nr:bifunctional UDP-N-acetylglucosamine diphosphorylase/glucosamine-1-phosphate N-acetyltransferase GlmU [Deinococcus detaillensis]TSA84644.1 UDP-N-acetylglucosamine diphosphorylase/glucosamine-1-phosphate N-acetyltransferase [Deinococcus detaillensis]
MTLTQSKDLIAPDAAQRPLDVVVLAAGAGTRMRSALPKMLHEVCGRPMVAWAVKAARDVGARDIVVVTGHGADQVEAALAGPEVRFARQGEQLGTGHAFLLGAAKLRGDADVLVLYGDSPMLSVKTLNALRRVHLEEQNALTVLTSRLADATGYGRIVRGESGDVERIVEQKAATPEELRLTEFNSGVYLMDARAPELAAQIGNDNAAQEYYLTDLLALYHQQGARVAAYCIPDPSEVMGANDRVQLAELARLMQRRINERHMRAGVTLRDPATAYIEDAVTIAPDVILEPGVVLRGQTDIGTGAVVGAYSSLTDTQLSARVQIRPHSVLEGARVGEGSDVGPFARLRAGAVLDTGVHIGNFVEVKNSHLAAGVKAGHLAYLGDASIGAESNIGAGTITANFDGVNKHRTQIGAGVFIGSNATLIAPVTLGDAAFVAGGSTVNADVPEGAMAVGRGTQRNIGGWSLRYWKRMERQVAQKLPWLSAWLSRQD